jgi:hypothetical protein
MREFMVAMLVNRAALCRHVVPECRERLVEAGPAVDNEEVRAAQPGRLVLEDDTPGWFY